MIVDLLRENQLEFILDIPDPYGKVIKASVPFKDNLEVFGSFRIVMASVTFKQDSLEESTPCKDYNQEASTPFNIIKLACIPLAFAFLVVVNHIVN